MSQATKTAATQRAALNDITRGRSRRPTALLKPRFVRQGVIDVGGGGGPGGAVGGARPSPSSAAVVFDEVLFEAYDDDDGNGGGGGPSRPVPMWVARPTAKEPNSAPPPAAILWLHGKGETRDAYLPTAARLAARGCLFAVPDMPYHGGRRREDDEAATSDADAFDAAVARAIRRGGGSDTYNQNNPLLLDWAWDGLCALDALQELYGGGAQHQQQNVVLAGTSMGGSAALLLAAALSGGGDKGPNKIAACVPLIALQYWRWGFENGDAWKGRADSLGPAALEAAVEVAMAAEQPNPSPREAWRRALSRLIPGILTNYDAPRVLYTLCLSGIPLLACNSASDPRCPLGGVEAAWREVEAEEEVAATRTRHELFVDDSARGHELTPAMMARVEAWLEEEGLLGKGG
jgi:acetyl esterase/lipase